MSARETSKDARQQRDVYLERVVREMEILVDMSLKLQSGIHTLDLAHSDTRTRMVLQSADTLTQTLMCIRSALDRMSRPETLKAPAGMAGLLEGVFLEDVRRRLLNGQTAGDARAKGCQGRVELF